MDHVAYAALLSGHIGSLRVRQGGHSDQACLAWVMVERKWP